MQPWKELIQPDNIEIVSPSGETRCRVKGYYGGTMFTIDDMKVDVQPGDEIRRALPNGKDEVFLVDDPKFYRDGHFGSHYQVKVSRRGSFAPKTGGNYNIHLSGANARVNVASTDNSTNTVNNSGLFADVKAALTGGVSSIELRDALIESLNAIERANTKQSFTGAYQRLISLAADHVTLLAPFLPALTQILTQLPS